MRYTLHHGDCIEVMRGMPADSVDSIVTDPPYGLTSARPGGRSEATRGAVMRGFMGLEWDGNHIAFDPAVWVEALRVLKPGGHLLAFGGSRTYHRLAAAIEDAGFEIRDQIMWIYGSGFPKSHNLDGAWSGWGTALKPAHEPICVARKPLAGTVAANMLAHGTGALNIDGCRVGDAGGRWPANVMHDGSEEVLQAFPNAPGQIARSREDGTQQGNRIYGAMKHGGQVHEPRSETDSSAARFFYCAKAGRADRNEGLDGLPDRVGGMNSNTSGQHITRRDGWTPEPVKNHHPTVKPTDLMRYLCRLVTPPGGLVLDPFMGSGSTGKAAILEGFRFVGCELQPEYIEIARARIQHAAAVEQHQYELEIA